jgi:hypothetical protein
MCVRASLDPVSSYALEQELTSSEEGGHTIETLLEPIVAAET